MESTKSKTQQKDWSIPNPDGSIDVPDELDDLFNKVGMQLKFHTISGLSELETIANICFLAQEYFNKPVKKSELTGAELICLERAEQIIKHGRTVQEDIDFNTAGQLVTAARTLSMSIVPDHYVNRPYKWDETIWKKMIQKSYKDRLVIAGALIAAEIDRNINK